MPKVVAVSVGTPKPMQVYGLIRPSSMVRQPSTEPVFFGSTGPVGHETAIHSAPACAFVAENYDYWAGHFGVPRHLWHDCYFGENLMIAGVHEDSVRSGDIFRFGSGAVLAVTGFRSICGKFVYRMGQPESALREINRIGWVGFYLKVVEPGFIGAGDSVSVTSVHPANMSVGELVRLFQDRDAGLDDLKRAISNPGLEGPSREALHKKVVHQEDVVRSRTLRWPGWRSFVVTECRPEAEAIRSIRITPADGDPVAPYRAGQFVSVRLKARGRKIVRNWSLSDYQSDASGYRLTVKRIAGGTGSGIVQQLAVGDKVELRPPAGQFVLDRSLSRRVVLISAGIGLTPVLSMLKAHALRGVDAPPLVWLHSTKSGATLALHDEVNALLASNNFFKRQLYFTAPAETDRRGADYDRSGRISRADIRQLVAQDYSCRLFGRVITLPGRTSLYYICGPAGFEEMVYDTLLEAGVDPAANSREAFRPTQASQHDPAIPRASIVFSESGAEAAWDRTGNLSLLELAEEQGLSPEYGCRMGMCSSCLVPLIEGEVEYSPSPQQPPSADEVLLCCARPKTKRVVVGL
jgi:ferredoxin-NADP reductase/MOSC domain-containing protein YiiM